MCKSTYYLLFSFTWLLLSTFLLGCENSEQKHKAIIIDSTPLSQGENPINTQETAIVENTVDVSFFAPTLAHERKGLWLGGAPPINKRASGINTYYRLKADDKPNQLIMTLRFEGVKADDARVSFRAIDGATFLQSSQRTHWRLKPNIASEISFTLVVPDNVSYLALDTFQNNLGASRAFLLKTLKQSRENKQRKQR